MKIVKNINNNYAIAIDDAGNKIVVSGKGIGFGEVPREIRDLKQINRSFYDVSDSYISMIKDIPEGIIRLSSKVIDKTRTLTDKSISSNIVFTLADHISFSIKRYEQNMNIKLPIIYDVEYLFEAEYKAGLYALELLRKEMNIYMPEEEASYIALHIINAEQKESDNRTGEDDFDIVERITQIIEQEFKISINKKSANYSRFVSHMHYLFKRGKSKHLVESSNDKLYVSIKKEYPKTNECVEEINLYLQEERNLLLTDEEKLYLMLHINRLCIREDCNQ